MFEILVQRTMKHTLKRLNSLETKVRTSLGTRADLDQLYFAYGANLSEKRLRVSGLRVERVGVALASQFRTEINMPCEYLEQGYAGLAESPEGGAPGVLFRTDPRSLLLLDVMEWVPFKFYRREKIEVYLLGSDVRYSAWAYLPCSPRENLKSSEAYKAFVMKSALEAGVPKEYLAQLEAFPTLTKFKIDHSFNLWNPARVRLAYVRYPFIVSKLDVLREKVASVIP